MMRLQKLGVATPDPTVQRNVLTHFVNKLAESNEEFKYRLNAYTLTKNLQGQLLRPRSTSCGGTSSAKHEKYMA